MIEHLVRYCPDARSFPSMKDMLGREEILSVERARKLLFKATGAFFPHENEERIELSLHRVVARDIASPEDMPGFTRSTMDGYAVNSSDTFGARETMPSYIKVAGEVHMGEKPSLEIRRGESAKIPTGGMLPNGTDAVVMFEHTAEVSRELIEIYRAVAPGENTIQAGEDCKKGERVLAKGQKMRPQDIGALAGLGITGVWLYEKPKVSVIATGDEVVSAKSPLKPGQVRDINSYTLAGLIEENSGTVMQKGICEDSFEILKNAVDSALEESQIVVITGGSSVGTKDLTAKVISSAGKPGILFHGVSVKPGKPTIGAVINGKPVFGLPGHPAAVSVSFELFIKPLLLLFSGETRKFQHDLKRTVKARLTKNIPSSSGRQDHIRVFLEQRKNGLWAQPLLAKSGLITTLVKGDGTIVVPLRKSGLKEGEEVEVELF
jgi:molybdopterin molybdotransferase